MHEDFPCEHRCCRIVERVCSCNGIAYQSPRVQSTDRSAALQLVRVLCGCQLRRGWSNGSLNIPGNNLYGGLTEFIGGVQAGYNFQAGHFLFGV